MAVYDGNTKGSHQPLQDVDTHEKESVSCSIVSDSAIQAPLSMELSKLESWSGLPFPSPGDLPDLGIKPRSPALLADSLLSEPPGKL